MTAGETKRAGVGDRGCPEALDVLRVPGLRGPDGQGGGLDGGEEVEVVGFDEGVGGAGQVEGIEAPADATRLGGDGAVGGEGEGVGFGELRVTPTQAARCGRHVVCCGDPRQVTKADEMLADLLDGTVAPPGQRAHALDDDQTSDAVGGSSRHHRGHGPPHGVTHEVDRAATEGCDQGVHVGDVVGEVGVAACTAGVALSEAALVEGDPTSGSASGDPPEGQALVEPAVQADDGRAVDRRALPLLDDEPEAAHIELPAVVGGLHGSGIADRRWVSEGVMGWLAAVMLLGLDVASATCETLSVETRVALAPPQGLVATVQVDEEVLIYVAEGAVDCQPLGLPAPPGFALERLRVRVRHADDTGPRFGMERVHRALAGSSGPGQPELHLPELRYGDLVTVRTRWIGPAADYAWTPGAWGSVGRATLKVKGELGLPGPEGASRILTDASLTDVVAQTPSAPVDPVPERIQSHEEIHTFVPGDLRRPLQDPRAGQVEVYVVRHETWGPQEEAQALFTSVPPHAEPGTLVALLDGEPLEVEPAAEGWWVSLPPSTTSRALVRSWGWTRSGLATHGSFVWAGSQPADRLSLVVQSEAGSFTAGAMGDVEVEPTAKGWVFRSDGVAAPSSDGLPAGDGGWNLAQVGDRAVTPTRGALLDEVAFYAILASMPEPGVPLRMKNQTRDDAVMTEVLDLLKRRVQPGSLPGVGPLRPRKLLQVRRSGWGTPWELALYASRLLRQVKADAVPFPLRPASLGPVGHDTPAAYPEAIVRLDIQGEVRWVDAACRQCALGEVRPELFGGWLLAEEPTRVPWFEAGEVALSVDGGTGTRTATLTGWPALELRQALLDVPVAERGGAVAAAVGGTALVSQEGISARGAPIQVVAEAAVPELLAPLVSLPDAEPEGADMVWLGPALGHSVTVTGVTSALPEGVVRIEAPGLSWTRSVDPHEGALRVVERLTVVDPAVPRDALQRWRRAVVAAAAEQKVAENREPNEAPASAPHEADVSGVGAEAQP